jgi:iron-sulfur cluster assembly protein
MSEITTLETASVTKEELTLTEKAINEVRKIMAENNIPDDFSLRVGVKGGGCSGLSYTLGFDSDIKETDKILNISDLKIAVDWKSILYLSGTSIDYTDGLTGKGFVFNNPLAKKTCGCGSSFGV